MPEPKVRVLLRRTMLAAGWGHIALAALFVLMTSSGVGLPKAPFLAALFLLGAVMAFRLARRMRTEAS